MGNFNLVLAETVTPVWLALLNSALAGNNHSGKLSGGRKVISIKVMVRNSGTSITLNAPPDMPELHQVLSQALEKRGQGIQMSWRVPHKMMVFVLEVFCDIKGGVPHWCLYFEHARKREMIFNYPSYDVLLVFNHINSSAAAVVQQHSQPKSVREQGQATQSARDAVQPTGYAAQPTAQPSGLESLRTSSLPPTYKSANVPNTTMPANAAVPAHAAPATNAAPASNAATVAPAIPDSGDLKKHMMPGLLQSITSAKMTGKLEVRNNQITATVYVQNGLVVDATAVDLVGDDALIELLTWKEGQFAFEPRVLRNSHTVHQTIEALVLQSQQLGVCMTYLREKGMKDTSTFLPKFSNLPELQFIQKAVPGAPTDGGTLLKFYRLLDGQQAVDELQRATQMSRVLIILIIHHLIANGLVVISNEKPPEKNLTVEPRAIDTAAIQGVMMSLRRPETGMFLYPAFLYFLEQEYFRSYRSGTPLSILVFEMRELRRGLAGEWIKQMLPTPAVLDAVLRISQLKRHVDLLAHYDAFDYAMLLPNTRANGAHTFASRIIRSLTSEPLGGIDPAQISLAFGSASIPDDFVDLSSLLGAADLAMNQAKQRMTPLIMYRDLKHSIS